MAEQKELRPVITDVTIRGNSIDIFTYYIDKLKNIYAFISNEVKTLNQVFFKENELGIVNDGYDETEFYLNNKGELIVFSDISDDFNISEEGQLTLDE